MKTETLSGRTYAAPATFVRQIEQEWNFLTSTPGSTLQDMDPNGLYDEEF